MGQRRVGEMGQGGVAEKGKELKLKGREKLRLEMAGKGWRKSEMEKDVEARIKNE